MDGKEGVAKGVLIQYIGPWKRPVAYLSKKLDAVAAGWPPYLKIIAAVATMVKDADKLAPMPLKGYSTPRPVDQQCPLDPLPVLAFEPYQNFVPGTNRPKPSDIAP